MPDSSATSGVLRLATWAWIGYLATLLAVGALLSPRLPNRMDVSILRGEANAFKVDFRPGLKFSSRGGLRDYIRIGFVVYDAGEIEADLMRLGQCLATST